MIFQTNSGFTVSFDSYTLGKIVIISRRFFKILTMGEPLDFKTITNNVFLRKYQIYLTKRSSSAYISTKVKK